MTLLRTPVSPVGQRGLVLVMVLLFVVLLNLLAVGVLQSAALQARMSGNIASRVEANLLAEDIIEAIATRPGAFRPSVTAGYVSCSANSLRADCDDLLLAAVTTLTMPAAAEASYYVARGAAGAESLWLRAPGLTASTPPEATEVVVFEVGARVEIAGAARGGSHIASGFAVDLSGTRVWPLYRREFAIDAL